MDDGTRLTLALLPVLDRHLVVQHSLLQSPILGYGQLRPLGVVIKNGRAHHSDLIKVRRGILLAAIGGIMDANGARKVGNASR